MIKLKKTIAVTLTFLLLISAVPFTAFGANIASGVYSDGTWRWEISADGTLTIEVADGIAAAEIGDIFPDSVPFEPYRDYVQKIVVGEGIEAIGSAFGFSFELTSVILPASLKRLGSWAFYACSSVSEIRFPENSALEYIDPDFIAWGSESYTLYGFENAVAEAFAAENAAASYAELAGCEHTEMIQVEQKDATCTEDGHGEYSYCANCLMKVGYTVIPATGHSLVDVPAVAPTCTEPGYTACQRCETCGEVFGRERLEEIDHTFGEAQIISLNGANYEENGFSLEEILDLTDDLDITDLRSFGIPMQDLIDYGFDEEDLLDYGYTEDDIEAGFITDEITPESVTLKVITCTMCGRKDYSLYRDYSWEYDDVTQTVTFSGTDLPDFEYFLDDIENTDFGENEEYFDAKKIVIESEVTALTDVCTVFENAEEIILPAGLTEIGDYAFSELTRLSSITIPSTVTEIGESAFENCRSLENIVLPAGLDRIEYSLFEDCESLESIVIPAQVETIAGYAFCGTAISNVTFANGSLIRFISQSWFGEDEYDGVIAAYGSGEDFYPEQFANENLTVYFNLIAIEDCLSQHGAHNMTSIAAKEPTCAENGYNAHLACAYGCGYCEGKELTPPTGHTFVYSEKTAPVLDEWQNITENGVYLAQCVNCDYSEEITYGIFCSWDEDEKALTVFGTGNIDEYYSYNYTQAPWYEYSSRCEKLIVRNGISRIEGCAFRDFTVLKTVNFGATVFSVSQDVFPDVSQSSITSVYCDKGSQLSSIDSPAFANGCVFYGYEHIYLKTYVGNYAGSYGYSYVECETIFDYDSETDTLTLTYQGRMPDYYNAEYFALNCDWYEYKDTAQTVIVSPSVTYLGSYSFYGFNSLETVYISSSLEECSEEAFAGCSNVTDVYYPSNNWQVISSLNSQFPAGVVHTYVAIVNDVPYYTFAEAAAAAGKTETIELICNIPDSYALKNRNDILKVRTNGYALDITAPSGFSVFSFTDNTGVTTYGVPYFYGQTLSTAGEIACNFYISLPAGSEDLLTVKANTTVGAAEKEYIYTTENMTPYSTYYIASVGVAAKDMGNTITMQIVDENDNVYGEIEYSVKQYCYNTINKNKDNLNREKLVNFAASILNYGAYAQLQFNVNTDNLVNAGLADYTNTEGNPLFTTDLSNAPVKDDSWKATGGTGNTENITFVGQTVSTTSNTQISYYLKLSDSIDNYTFSVTKAGTATTKAISVRALSGSSQYNCVVTILDIPAKNLGDVYTLTVATDSETAEKNYSVLTYIFNQYDKGGTLDNMVRAMYLYYAAAAEYFN